MNDLDIDDTLLFGLTVGYDFSRGLRNDAVIELDAQYDILEGNGGVLTPRFRWRSPIAQRMAVEYTLSATWASEDYLDNRFGIGSQDAQRSGLGRYDADAGFKNATLTGSLSYQLAPAWTGPDSPPSPACWATPRTPRWSTIAASPTSFWAASSSTSSSEPGQTSAQLLAMNLAGIRILFSIRWISGVCFFRNSPHSGSAASFARRCARSSRLS